MKRLLAKRLLAAAVLTLAGAGAGAGAADDAERFQPIYQLLTHPRCQNCHTAVAFPRQGDERRPHDMRVARGADNRGVPAMRCASCHSAANNAFSGAPGAPHWQLAPLAMGWEGMSAAQLCQRLLDRSKNGQRSAKAIVAHIETDALVTWGWAPGNGRAPASPSREQTIRQLHEWLAAGAKCPT